MTCCGVLLAFFDGFVDVAGLSVELGLGFVGCVIWFVCLFSFLRSLKPILDH